MEEILKAFLGGDNVSTDPNIVIDGIRPSTLVTPRQSAEVAEILRVSKESATAVVPAGRMTWLECGNPLRRAEVVLSLARMDRVIDYSPADLTITVEAGLPIRSLNATVMREGQWLPLDPPGSPEATIGAVAACASSGTLRSRFGTPRDWVIGLKLAHIDGSQSKSGGRVVKNVAGYDMNKLYVGSYGTLAVITEATFKLRPLPERNTTVIVGAPDLSLRNVASRIAGSELQPASLFLASSDLPARQPVASNVLLARFTDDEQAVSYQIERVKTFLHDDCECAVLSESDAEATWDRIRNPDRERAIAIRASVLPSKAYAALEALLPLMERPLVAFDLGSGIIRIAFDAGDREGVGLIRSARREIESLGGTLSIERASMEIRGQIDALSDPGPAAKIMRSIKQSFDPDSLLSPGRLGPGI